MRRQEKTVKLEKGVDALDFKRVEWCWQLVKNEDLKWNENITAQARRKRRL